MWSVHKNTSYNMEMKALNTMKQVNAGPLLNSSYGFADILMPLKPKYSYVLNKRVLGDWNSR